MCSRRLGLGFRSLSSHGGPQLLVGPVSQEHLGCLLFMLYWRCNFDRSLLCAEATRASSRPTDHDETLTRPIVNAETVVSGPRLGCVYPGVSSLLTSGEYTPVVSSARQ
jgi:hypothetical protein